MRSAAENVRNRKLYLYMKIKLQWDDTSPAKHCENIRNFTYKNTVCAHNTEFLDATAGG